MARTRGATNKSEQEHKKDAEIALLKSRIAKQKSQIKTVKN